MKVRSFRTLTGREGAGSQGKSSAVPDQTWHRIRRCKCEIIIEADRFVPMYPPIGH